MFWDVDKIRHIREEKTYNKRKARNNDRYTNTDIGRLGTAPTFSGQG